MECPQTSGRPQRGIWAEEEGRRAHTLERAPPVSREEPTSNETIWTAEVSPYHTSDTDTNRGSASTRLGSGQSSNEFRINGKWIKAFQDASDRSLETQERAVTINAQCA